MKQIYKKILVLGFVFLALSYTWSVYNSFTPALLKKFSQSNSITDFIMTLDNYANLFILPIFAVISDKISTRLGRRVPFLIPGMAAAAVIMLIIPAKWNMVPFVASIIGFNIVMAAFRGPAIALMPDLTPGNLRGAGFGIISTMGGIGAVIAYLSRSYLFNLNRAYPFYVGAVLITASLIVICIVIMEKKDCINYYDAQCKGKEDSEIDEEVQIEKSRNVFFTLISIFFTFCSFNALGNYLTVYGTYHVGMSEAQSARMLTVFSVITVVFALPAGLLGDKIGSKKAIIWGQSFMILIFAALFFTKSISMMQVLLGLSGLCWAVVYINSYPAIISMADKYSIGRFTGYYYMFASLSAIVSPIASGMLMNALGFSTLFVFTGVCFTLSLLFFIPVKQETDLQEYSDLVKSDYTLT